MLRNEMAPREARHRHRSSSRREVGFQEAAKRVLRSVRSLRIKQRALCTEFEVRPDACLFPLYFQLIHDPVFLQDIDDAIHSNRITSPETLAERFKLLVKNAKVFNKPGSTISKDASRLYDAFRTAMKEEFGMVLDEYEDEDEEDAWHRDLAERPRLAAAERDAYHELQASWTRAKPAKGGSNAKVVRQFTTEVLNVVDVPYKAQCKKELSRSELVESLMKLPLSGTNRCFHSGNDCSLCHSTTQEVKKPSASKVECHVLTPQYRIITPVYKKKSARHATESMKIEPVADKTLKRRAVTSLDSPTRRQKMSKLEPTSHDSSVASKRRRNLRSESPVAVSDIITGWRVHGGK